LAEVREHGFGQPGHKSEKPKQDSDWNSEWSESIK